MTFGDWYSKLTEDSLWYELLRAYKDETIRKAGEKVYAQLVAEETVSYRPMSENRKHVYNIVCKNPGDKVNKPWYKIEEQKKEAENEWKPASPEHVDKCVAEFDAMMKQSTMVNAFPRIGYKQAVEEGGWLPPKPKPYPMTTEEEAYARQRHIEYIKANYEPRTGAKLPEWIEEDEWNKLYDEGLL